MKKSIVWLLCVVMNIPAVCGEELWRTHFSYTDVQQIAVSTTSTFALANGAMFSVDKRTERITTYNTQMGMHGVQICHIVWDEARKQLLIFYKDGKMDVFRSGRFHYISDLYQKRMMASKECANVTIVGSLAYLAMPFGILTFDLEKNEFPNSFIIGNEATELAVQDVLVEGDSIYAKTEQGVLAAALKDNLVDFRYWKKTSPSVAFDTKKGKIVVDENQDVWQAMGAKGVYRHQNTGETCYYLPQGPINNLVSRMTSAHGRLYAVPGDRWASQSSKPGQVMIYDGKKWTNIPTDSIQAITGKPALDFMHVAVDPLDADHYVVASYGTGVYEFHGTKVTYHYTQENSRIKSVVPKYPNYYTRTDGVVYDSEGVLWVEVASSVESNLVAILPDSTQYGLNMREASGEFYHYETPERLILDNHNENRKWFISCRSNMGVGVLDDGGTKYDEKDDKFVVYGEWIDQDLNIIKPDFLYTIVQAKNGDIWVGSFLGPFIIEASTDYFSGAHCRRLRIPTIDGYLLEEERVNAIAFDGKQRIWIGTQNAGVYILNEQGSELLLHYTSSNSVMPSNTIKSMCYDEISDVMYVATGDGLVSCDFSPDTTTNLYEPTSPDVWTFGDMKQWKTHFAYTSVDEAEVVDDEVFAISEGTLFSVNSVSENITCYNQESGLSSTGMEHIVFNPTTSRMLMTYQNGQMDIYHTDGVVTNIPDLFLKSISGSKQVNAICMYGTKAYLAMSFGIMVVDMRKQIIEDTYYIGNEAKEVNVRGITIVGDSIYACSDDLLYSAWLGDNLIDFAYWNRTSMPRKKDVVAMVEFNNQVCVLQDSVIWHRENNVWKSVAANMKFTGMNRTGNHLYVYSSLQSGYWEVTSTFTPTYMSDYGQVQQVKDNGSTRWLATQNHGLVRYDVNGYQDFQPEGPLVNMPYRLKAAGKRLYMLQGGRWASGYGRQGMVMYYEDGLWTKMDGNQINEEAGGWVIDFMNVAQDPKDKDHFFVTSYASGLLELRNNHIVNRYTATNSSLQSAVPSQPNFYTRTDGAMYDRDGYLWVLNAGCDKSVHVIDPNGQWSSFILYANREPLQLNTPGELWQDLQRKNYKWIPLCRATAGLILLDDNGTPTYHGDDKVTYRTLWFDQNSKQVVPSMIYSMAQDKDNTLWIGTAEGLFLIPNTVDFATSNRCERVIIARDDGSGLGDYLLGSEKINAIAIDGANRKWIGTAGSGVYLMSADGTQTIAHFTTANSLMPSNEVLSIAIIESTGEVYIGTSTGLVSYMSDASEPESSYDNLYAFPNPVRPSYRGYITIRGLMADTQVRIVDAAGNLVKLLQGNGGEAVWDGTNTVGKRVATGVYTALCNTTDGQKQSSCKILLLSTDE